MFDRIQFKHVAKDIVRKRFMEMATISFLWYLIVLTFVSFTIDTEKMIVDVNIFGYIATTLYWEEATTYIRIFSLLLIIYTILIKMPFEAGLRRYYCKVIEGKASLSEFLSGFKNGYSRTMATLVVRDIFTILGFFLLIIPGISKYYGYRWVPYLLQDEPEMTTMEILRKSEEMMQGYKMAMFFLDLSFLPFSFLDYLTGGVTSIYSIPYQSLTEAQVYLFLREKNKGVV